MDSLWHDIKFAWRTLRKSLSVTLLAIFSLALAIGGNTSVFSLINGLLYGPLPFDEPDRLYLLGEQQEGTKISSVAPASLANMLDWEERLHSFEDLAAFLPGPVSLTDGDQPVPLNTGKVSTELFAMLGTKAKLGRVFLPEEGLPGGHRVAVLSLAMWQNRFAGATDILEREIQINGENHLVVGVLGEDFELLDPTIRLWLPLPIDRGKVDRQLRNALVLGRLAEGATDSSAKAELAALGKTMAAEFPDANRGWEINSFNMRHEIPDRRTRTLFWMLQGALVFVLLIACANVANLLLARSQRRQKEIALRSSLGASRGQILRQLAVESLLMATAAGVIGLILGSFGSRQLGAMLEAQVPTYMMPTIDLRTILFTVGVTLLGAVLFGLAPITQSFRLDLTSALKDGGQGATAGGRRKRLSSLLVVSEIALALVLLSGATVLIRGFVVLQNTDPGFDSSNLLIFQVELGESNYPGDERLIDSTQQLTEQLAHLPGVLHATASNGVPRSPFTPTVSFTLDDQPIAEDELPPSASLVTSPPGYFEVLGIPLHQGRVFSVNDRADSAPVVVVNQTLARRFWPEQPALGQRLTIQGISREVVGVVPTVQHGLLVADEDLMALYLPFSQQPSRSMVMILRTQVEPESLGPEVRGAVQGFDPRLAIARLQSLDTFVEQFKVGSRLFTYILSAFGSLALLLAALGTYGVLAYNVAQRRREIGLRMAIGARRAQVVQMIASQGIKLALIGIVVGLPGVFLVTRAITQLLSGLITTDPRLIGMIALLLALVSLVASLLPASKAASIDPIRALRQE